MGFAPDEAAAILGWWQAMGVDVAVRGEPPSWRAVGRYKTGAPSPGAVAPTPAPTVSTKAEPAKSSPSQGEPPALPEDAEAIAQWLAERSARMGARHLPVTVETDAPLLVLTACADESQSVFTREAAILFERMMKAAQFETPAPYPMDPAFRPGQREVDLPLVEATRRIVRAANPAKILIFGDAAARVLLDTPLAKARGKLHRVEGVPSVATFHPRWLLERPRDKRLAWEDLLILSGAE